MANQPCQKCTTQVRNGADKRIITSKQCVMAGHGTLSRRSDKEQHTDMHDDETVSHATSYTISYLPLSDLAPRIPCPVSDDDIVYFGRWQPSPATIAQIRNTVDYRIIPSKLVEWWSRRTMFSRTSLDIISNTATPVRNILVLSLVTWSYLHFLDSRIERKKK